MINYRGRPCRVNKTRAGGTKFRLIYRTRTGRGRANKCLSTRGRSDFQLPGKRDPLRLESLRILEAKEHSGIKRFPANTDDLPSPVFLAVNFPLEAHEFHFAPILLRAAVPTFLSWGMNISCTQTRPARIRNTNTPEPGRERMPKSWRNQGSFPIHRAFAVRIFEIDFSSAAAIFFPSRTPVARLDAISRCNQFRATLCIVTRRSRGTSNTSS